MSWFLRTGFFEDNLWETHHGSLSAEVRCGAVALAREIFSLASLCIWLMVTICLLTEKATSFILPFTQHVSAYKDFNLCLASSWDIPFPSRISRSP